MDWLWLTLERLSDSGHFEALELFCGMGGLSSGFVEKGIRVTGVDISEKAGQTFSSNRLGTFVKKNLMTSSVCGEFDLVIGGPPCEPWSCLNLTRRGAEHPLYSCLGVFFKTVQKLKPDAFVMENVPAIQKDPSFLMNLKALRKRYDTITRTFRYIARADQKLQRNAKAADYQLKEQHVQPPKPSTEHPWEQASNHIHERTSGSQQPHTHQPYWILNRNWIIWNNKTLRDQ